MVQKARVTLWVFRLTSGDDCEDAPLGGQAEDQIAAVSPPEPPTQKASLQAAAPTTVRSEDSPSSPVHQQVIPATKPKSKGITAPLPAVPSEPDVVEASQKAPEATPAEKPDSTAETRVASLNPSEQN